MARLGVGVDVGRDSVKLVAGRFRGESFQLLRARRIPLAAGADLSAALKEAAGGRLRGWALLGLTGRDVVLRYTHVPAVSRERLESLMAFEIQEILTQSGGEVVADYAPLPLDEGPEDEDLVLLGLVKQSFLEERLRLLAGAGIRPGGACPNAIALFNAFLKNGDFRSEEVTLLVNLGAENCDLALQKNAQLLFARNLSFGGRDFTRALAEGLGVDETRAEKLKRFKADLGALLPGGGGDREAERLARHLVNPAGRLFSTIQSSVTFAKNQTKIYNLNLGRVLLTGGGARLKGLDRYLAQNLGVPVEVFDPLPAVDTGLLPPEEAQAALARGRELTVALGLAQMAVDERFFRLTLLPEAMRRAARFRERTVYLVGAGLAGVLFLGASFYAAARAYDDAAARVSRLQREKVRRTRLLRRHEELLRQRRELAAKVERLARRANLGPALLTALQAVSRHLPPELWVRELKAQSEPWRPGGGKTRPRRRGALLAPVRREPVPAGPPVPTVTVVVAGEERGRPLVPVINAFVAALEKEPAIAALHREDRLQAGKAEVTLRLAMVSPPGAARGAAEGE